MKNIEMILPEENSLYTDVCKIIDNRRIRVATYLNTEICLINWHVGKRIKEDVLYNQRADYGKQIVKQLAKRLTEKYGNGWGIVNFYIVYALRIFFQKKRLYTQRVYN